MDDKDFRSSVLEIFTEAFEGVKPGAEGTWFVEGRQCLLATFTEVTAEQASLRPNGSSSIAAHLNHARYYLWSANAFGRGEEPKLDWESSWSVQTVDDGAWSQLRSDLVNEYQQVCEYMRSGPIDKPDIVTGIIANVAHAAFHLGAVRQLMKMV